MKPLTYEDARRKARARFGVDGDVARVMTLIGDQMVTQYVVGVHLVVNEVRKFVFLGVGDGWEQAFGNVRET